VQQAKPCAPLGEAQRSRPSIRPDCLPSFISFTVDAPDFSFRQTGPGTNADKQAFILAIASGGSPQMDSNTHFFTVWAHRSAQEHLRVFVQSSHPKRRVPLFRERGPRARRVRPTECRLWRLPCALHDQAGAYSAAAERLARARQRLPLALWRGPGEKLKPGPPAPRLCRAVGKVVPPRRIELRTPSLPMTCSTTELWRRWTLRSGFPRG
jgi:hypothetical protein